MILLPLNFPPISHFNRIATLDGIEIENGEYRGEVLQYTDENIAIQVIFMKSPNALSTGIPTHLLIVVMDVNNIRHDTVPITTTLWYILDDSVYFNTEDQSLLTLLERADSNNMSFEFRYKEIPEYSTEEAYAIISYLYSKAL